MMSTDWWNNKRRLAEKNQYVLKNSQGSDCSFAVGTEPNQQMSTDWQNNKRGWAEKNKYLLESSLWSDCRFAVGTELNQKIFQCHKFVLAISSPVFEAMFFGEMAEKNETISILDVQPGEFKGFLDYVYTEKVKLESFDQVLTLYYIATKYLVLDLKRQCLDYINRNLSTSNVCRVYEFANVYEEKNLMKKCLSIIKDFTTEVLCNNTFKEIEFSTLMTILEQEDLEITEFELFNALECWAESKLKWLIV